MRGIYPPKLKKHGEYLGKLSEVQCDKHDHVGADQIFKILHHPNWYTPTIKHACPRTIVASSLRACSNKVEPDPKIFDGYAKWFRSVYIPKFLKFLDNEVIEVNFDKWLDDSSYTKIQKQQLRETFKPENYKYSHNFKGFTKIEMQDSNVPHELKNTEMNTTKERQICGPDDHKKCLANPFINLLEGVAHKYVKEYCGRKNWLEICHVLDEAEINIKNLIMGDGDGSGFDMTQLKQHNELMNEFIMACARHPNVIWVEPLTVKGLKEALSSSLVLNVSMDGGKLIYTAQGRASGDGWTTFSNTMLMISYWEYTFNLAQINDYFLLVKGDDVLFGLDRNLKDKFEYYRNIIFTDRKDEHKHGLGQICTEIHYGDIVDLSFLSNHFFRTDNGLRMTRIPRRIIQSNCWSVKVPKFVKGEKLDYLRKQLCFNKGMSLLAWGTGLPIWQVLGEKMVELGLKGSFTDSNHYVDDMRVWYPVDNYEDYLYYLESKHNVTPMMVKNIEEKISMIDSINGSIDIEELDLFFR
jgi:hypothetical protein